MQIYEKDVPQIAQIYAEGSGMKSIHLRLETVGFESPFLREKCPADRADFRGRVRYEINSLTIGDHWDLKGLLAGHPFRDLRETLFVNLREKILYLCNWCPHKK